MLSSVSVPFPALCRNNRTREFGSGFAFLVFLGVVFCDLLDFTDLLFPFEGMIFRSAQHC